MRVVAPHTALDALGKLYQEHGYTAPGSERSCMIRWLAQALRYLLMSSTERYLGHAINRSDFERRLRAVRRRI
jgi:hypothetical protein